MKSHESQTLRYKKRREPSSRYKGSLKISVSEESKEKKKEMTSKQSTMLVILQPASEDTKAILMAAREV